MHWKVLLIALVLCGCSSKRDTPLPQDFRDQKAMQAIQAIVAELPVGEQQMFHAYSMRRTLGGVAKEPVTAPITIRRAIELERAEQQKERRLAEFIWQVVLEARKAGPLPRQVSDEERLEAIEAKPTAISFKMTVTSPTLTEEELKRGYAADVPNKCADPSYVLFFKEGIAVEHAFHFAGIAEPLKLVLRSRDCGL